MSSISDHIRTTDTWKEIHAQPGIWRAWADEFNLEEIRTWVDAQEIQEVWFCGAGTSIQIGDIIASGITLSSKPKILSVPSTDLVAQPSFYLKSAPISLLIVNFDRSGNSGESEGTLRTVEALAPNAVMLNITCNPEGALIKSTIGRSILLPAACHDAGFAMTSSFSAMLLTALAIFDRSTDGRKSFITTNTTTYVLLNTSSDAIGYDHDLVKELREQFPGASMTTIGSQGDIDIDAISLPAWDTVLSVLPAELAGIIWSAQLDLNIDDPFMGKSTLSRVVVDVRLHQVEAD
jgi:hypothetical protein